MIRTIAAWWRRRTTPKQWPQCRYCGNVATIRGVYCGDCWDLTQSGWAG